MPTVLSHSLLQHPLLNLQCNVHYRGDISLQRPFLRSLDATTNECCAVFIFSIIFTHFWTTCIPAWNGVRQLLYIGLLYLRSYSTFTRFGFSKPHISFSSTIVSLMSFLSSWLCYTITEPTLLTRVCILDRFAGILLQFIVVSRKLLLDKRVITKPACKPISIVAAFLPGPEVSTS